MYITMFLITIVAAVACAVPTGVTRQNDVELTGREVISKRDVAQVGLEDDLEMAANTIVFRPLFRSKTRYTNRRRTRAAEEDLDDLETAANTIIFRPNFRSQRRNILRRRFRSVEENEVNKSTLPDNAQDIEDMETAEYFLRPYFRKGFNRRVYRDLPDMITFRPLFASRIHHRY